MHVDVETRLLNSTQLTILFHINIYLGLLRVRVWASFLCIYFEGIFNAQLLYMVLGFLSFFFFLGFPRTITEIRRLMYLMVLKD